MDSKPLLVDDTKITITIPTNAYFMSGIRDFTLSLIKNTTHFSEKWAFRFQSVVDELCNNAIEHGSAKGEFITVTFICHTEKDVEIIVEDTGTGPEKMKAADLQKLVTERKAPQYVFEGIRGRGLPKIVSEWTDELEFTDRPEGGIKVRVKKFLKDPRYQISSLESLQEDKANQPNHIVLTD